MTLILDGCICGDGGAPVAVCVAVHLQKPLTVVDKLGWKSKLL